MSHRKYTYINHIPLAGGFALGNMAATNNLPVAITSFSPFESNDALFLRYLRQKGYDVPYYQLDKLDINSFTFLSKKYSHIDFATSIPPCSGLSQAAQRKPGTRGTAEPNEWMYRSAEFILGAIKPTVYVFENAPTLYSGAGDEVRKRLIKIGEEFGYSITFYKTNTLKHGIPQFRLRTFAVYCQGPQAPILNTYNKVALPLKDYLKLIPQTASLQDVYVHNEWDISKFEITKFLIKKHGPNWREELLKFRTHLTTYDYLLRKNWLKEFLEWQKSLPENERSEIVTKNVEHIIKKKEMGKGARINYRVLELDKDYTYAVIGEMMGKQIHPVEDRLLNIREFLWLMGMPFDYEIDNPRDYIKLSQNAPVNTCMDITTEIIEIINGNRNFAKSSVYMQDNTKSININKSKSLF